MKKEEREGKIIFHFKSRHRKRCQVSPYIRYRRYHESKRRESSNGISLLGWSRWRTLHSIAPIYGGFRTKRGVGAGDRRQESGKCVREEKTRTFRINIVPRSRKEKGRSSDAREKRRGLHQDSGNNEPSSLSLCLSFSLSSVVAITVDFTASEGGSLFSNDRRRPSALLSPPPLFQSPSSRALSRKSRHFNVDSRGQR